MTPKHFPDESQMPRSSDGSEPIRGGSVGLNRILSMFTIASSEDKRPRFTGVFLNAFTIVDNILGSNKSMTQEELDKAFALDLDLFLDYYNTYLSHVRDHVSQQRRYAPVIVYFSDYDRLPETVRREFTGNKKQIQDTYKKFRNRHRHETGLVKTLEFVQCFFVKAGPATYPHRELNNVFKEITFRNDTLYSRGDPVGIMTHVVMDLYLGYRIRNLHLIERYTGRVKPQSEFPTKLDKEGRLPLQGPLHAVVGDSDTIRPMVTGKLKNKLLEQAEKERWRSLNQSEVTSRISKIIDKPVSELTRLDFG